MENEMENEGKWKMKTLQVLDYKEENENKMKSNGRGK